MTEQIDALHEVPLFGGMSDKDLQKILEISKEVTHQPGETIVEQDRSAVGFHLILKGEAEAEVGGTSVGVMSPGDYFGEISLLDGKPRSATVRATTELVTLSVPAWNFNQLLDQHPEMMRSLLQELCARIRHTEEPRH
jgi:CRP/FNR family transcriptional regulator, cyclic AMP receptor protein